LKPFVFALTPVLKLKQAQEKQQAAALSSLRQRIRELLEDAQGLDVQIIGLTAEAERQSAQGMPPWKMEGYARYARRLFEQKDRLKQETAARLEEAEALQRALLALRQEMKLLQNLREKRYASYLMDLQAAQQMEMDERIAFLEGARQREA
jgi:flagellar export protein FliJ